MSRPMAGPNHGFTRWYTALQQRFTGDLEFRELRRALQAVSRIYVHERARVHRGEAFNSRGKRAAFALFYGTLHWLTVSGIVARLQAPLQAAGSIWDLGCGTGVGGAAWATASNQRVQVRGVDLSPWALQEARWTYQQVQLPHKTLKKDVTAVRLPPGEAVLAAFSVNELSDTARQRMLSRLLDASAAGGPVLVVEPIAHTAVPWWPQWEEAFQSQGGRSDTWRLPAVLPDLVARLDRAAGMRHTELTARSLFMPGQAPAAV